MQSQTKVKRCFRDWQGITIEEKVKKYILKRSDSYSKQNVKRRVQICFQHWQGIYYKTKNMKKCFRNWQGIYLDDINDEEEEESILKISIGTQPIYVPPPTSQAQIDLRRCYKNWQGIYLDYMDFEQQVPNIVLFDHGKTRDIGTEPMIQLEPELTFQILESMRPSSDNESIDIKPFSDSGSSDSSTTSTNKQRPNTPKPNTLNESYFIQLDLSNEMKLNNNDKQEDSFTMTKKEKKRRYTGEFNSKIIQSQINTSFSTPLKNNNNKLLLQQHHKEFLMHYIDTNPTAVLNEAFESFTNEFQDFIIKKSQLQNYIKNELNIKVLSTTDKNYKKEMNSKFNTQRRKDWVNAWSSTSIDFTKNCVFIECPRLNVIMKSGGLPTKRPELKVTPRYFFVAISTIGIIETHLFQPSVKREDPYVDFIHHILNQLDKSIELKNSYIVLNGMHDWLLDDLDEIISDRGYNCVYLPPFPAALNPITEFWNLVKYGIRRQYLYEGETIADRINESRHHISKQEIDTLILSSKLYFNRCLHNK